MFVLDQSDSYLWPVSVELPDNGRKRVFTFDAEFLRLPEQECFDLRQRYIEVLDNKQKLLSASNGYDDNTKAVSDQGYEEICDEVLCGWSKVADAAGEPLEFTEANKRKLYSVQGACLAILKSWFESLGEPAEKSAAKAGGFRAKNS